MAERERWVAKAEAAREMQFSISTLDRMIRRGEIEVRREGRRVYVRMEGPERVSDEELLRRALDREDKLRLRVWELDGRASQLELERDEARDATSASAQAYAELDEVYRKEQTELGQARWLAFRLGLVAALLFVLLVGSVLLWWFVLR